MTNISQLCRACLTIKDSFTYVLFENVSPDVYCFCTSLEVNLDEGLPRSICNKCYDLITKYSEFKRTCIQSQNTLLGYKNNLKTETRGRDQLIKNEEIENQDKPKDEIVHVSVKVENADGCDYDYADVIEYPIISAEHNKAKLRKRKIKKLVKLKHSIKEISIKAKRKKFIYSCELCRKKFNYKERFEAHKLEHEGKSVSISCYPCKKTFMTWNGLKKHNESEHTVVNLESLKCKTCGKIFKNRYTLKLHQQKHEDRKLIVCDICGKGVTTAANLKAHIETHNTNRERRFTCEHCGNKFFTKPMLLTHVSRRHTDRRFICEICSYPFTEKCNLIKHLRIHEGTKLNKCDICNKSYARQSTLLEHKRLHSGERPYVCSYCPKAFVSKKRLTDHVRIHTGVKPYQCPVCDQRFTQRGTLKRHMKVHDRIVPNIQ